MGPSHDDLDDEIRGHLAISEQERLERGEDPEAARRAARKEFGNLTLTRDSMRRVWRSRWLDVAADLGQDLRYAGRVLRRSPAFSVVVVLVLAIGIAANATVFTLVKSVLLQPLPGVVHAARLNAIVARMRDGQPMTLTYPDYEYVRDHDTAFTGVSASAMEPFSVGLGSRTERIWGELVSPNYFQTLGVGASLGRTVLPTDDGRSGQPAIAVISQALWRRQFASDPAVVGRTIVVNGHTLTIAGVTAGEFRGSVVGLLLDLFIPTAMQPELLPPDQLHNRDSAMFLVLGRPRPELSASAVAARTNLVSKELSADTPIEQLPTRAAAIPLSRSPFGAQTYVLPLAALLGVMGALLLVVVSANLSNLVLARGLARRGEIAVRRALGASQLRVLRLLFLESIALAVPGALAGLALSRVVGRVITAGSATLASTAPTGFGAASGWLDVAFALTLAVAAALLFGFVPALRTARVSLASVIKDEGQTAPSKSRVRGALVVAQVAVSLLLLVGAGLAARTALKAGTADAGFDPTGVVSVSVDVEPSGYDETRGRAFYDHILDALRSSPGVDAASLANNVPLSLVPANSRRISPEGYEPRRDESLIIPMTVVDRDYFRTLTIPIVAGRAFGRFDSADAPPVIVVDTAFARRFYGGVEAAVGKRVRASGKSWTVVGVAGEVKHTTLTERSVGYMYCPFAQDYHAAMTIHARAAGVPVEQLVEHVRDAIVATDPNLPVLEAHTLTEQARVGLFLYGIAARMLLVVGALGIGLAALGIYGLIAYMVKQSRHEIGIRLALGASAGDVIALFLRRALRLGLTGIVVGLALSVAAARLVASLLYGVSPLDPVAFGAALLTVLGVLLAASFVPSWQASRTELTHALRRL